MREKKKAILSPLQKMESKGNGSLLHSGHSQSLSAGKMAEMETSVCCWRTRGLRVIITATLFGIKQVDALNREKCGAGVG